MAKKKPKYWNNGKIPADLFFEILSTGNLDLLIIKGSTTETKLITAWEDIFDEYFLLEDDGKFKLIQKTQERVRKSIHKIEWVKDTLKILAVIDLTAEMFERTQQALKKVGVTFDYTKGIEEEIERVMSTTIAHWSNDLELEKDNLSNLNKGAKTTYEESLVGIENAIGRASGEKISLRKYCALKKSAQEISKQHKNKK
jgi:hypothetical protein